jgi:hypothetical protein
MKVSEPQRRALEAVAAGRVKHMHPFTWVVDLVDLEEVTPRTLQALARNKLIRVRANEAETQRPVELTEAGRRALGSHEVAS